MTFTREQIHEIMLRHTDGNINFWDKNIGDEGCEKLAAYITDNKCFVSHLFLGDNNIGPVGCRHLADALKTSTTLIELHLCNNHIGVLGCMHVRDIMKGCSSLRDLSLHTNNVGNCGIAHILNALRHGSRLSHLDISHTGFDEYGSRLVEQVMRETSSIERLSVFDNGLRFDTACQLMQLSYNNRQRIKTEIVKFNVFQTLVICGKIRKLPKNVLKMICDNIK